MIICFEVVFNRVLSNSKTHLIVKLETFLICAERARDSDGVVAPFARPLTNKYNYKAIHSAGCGA
jgi:hypothetical protein